VSSASTLDEIELDLSDRRVGKVRVSYEWSPTERLFITTDRLSAFDRIIATVPHKGQVLNQLSAWWFERTRSVVANHLVSVPDPNVTIGRTAHPLPVEVVVRGYITGVTSTSLWRQYADGARTIYGYDLPDGISKNTALPHAIVTPTTKAHAGAHDEPITCAQVVEQGLVSAALWEQVCTAALELFSLGQTTAAEAGLILADTKYEFGLAADTGALLLIDEVHTPDSSRYWMADSYADRLAIGEEPESLDKEVVRRALIELGYDGAGAPPVLPAQVVAATSLRYISAFERITGQPFVPAPLPALPRIQRTVASLTSGSPLEEDPA
jgi:phosphoribosylaminoimidazole-succinocarboxamide synthase